jgi:hypothetical protein
MQIEWGMTRCESWQTWAERCEDLKLLRCLIRPSLRHEKHRSFLFSRLDLLKRTDPGEAVRNADYIMYSTFIRYRRSLRSSHLSSQVCHDSHRVTLLELLISILSNLFRYSNESNQKAIRDRSSKVETLNTWCNLHYSMYSTFLTASPGSNLLKRKDLCSSWLRLGPIRHRRSLRSSNLFSSGLTRFRRVTTREADILVNISIGI